VSYPKTPSDVQAIQQSVAAAEAAMTAVVKYLASNMTPTSEQAKTVLDEVLTSHNCHSPESRIVASGIKTHEPHYMGEGAISKGEPIVIDIYPQSKETGFFADMTRTVCLGEPASELQAIYNAVTQVHKQCVAQLQPGVSCDAIHQSAVDQFNSLGYQSTGVGSEFKFSEGFVHSIGHGLGRDVHEEPFFGSDRGNTLQVGDVVTIEPGLYYKHIGGVRLEDLFVITEHGYQQLTTLPLKLRVQDW
jgi:Xaa-Pro aminopeptidase